jgi:subtilisin family serine protease
MRRIVVVRPREELRAGFDSRNFALAGTHLDTLKVSGMEFDEALHPARIPSLTAFQTTQASGFHYATAPTQRTGSSYCVRVDFEDQDAIQRLLTDQKAEVEGVFVDLPISTMPAYCGDTAVGNTADVQTKLGVSALQAAGLTGKRVRVAVVDTGIDGRKFRVGKRGWGPSPDFVPGSNRPLNNTDAAHATMVAYDIRIAAPDVTLLDYALLQSQSASWRAFLSDAIAAYSDLLGLLIASPGSLVVNNSWGLYDRGDDEPVGSPGNYSANPDHPFNQLVGSLVQQGADILFAAGNCGDNCPDNRCGIGDRGAGFSIHGANSHPDVLTVAAVTVKNQRLGYSSQGPGGLHDRKPDLAGFSHFAGSGVYPLDGGTSAACPTVAGVVAALRQKGKGKKLNPVQMKALLQRTANDWGGTGWNHDTGYGVVEASAALRHLLTP